MAAKGDDVQEHFGVTSSRQFETVELNCEEFNTVHINNNVHTLMPSSMKSR